MLRWTVVCIELAGISAIAGGATAASAEYLIQTVLEGRSVELYQEFRGSLARAILLGLECFIAAKILLVAVVERTLYSVVVLAEVLVIRAILGLAHEVETGSKRTLHVVKRLRNLRICGILDRGRL